MPYRFEPAEDIAAGARRVMLEQLDGALAAAVPGGDVAHAVHDLRKRCKKMRGLLRLLRGGAIGERLYAAENACLRDTARLLAGARDARVLSARFADLAGRFEGQLRPDALERCRAALGEEARTRQQAAPPVDGLRQADERLRALRLRVLDWEAAGDGFALVDSGLARTYRRGRKACRAALVEPGAGRLHEWRKRVKYHMYHLRLLREAGGVCGKARRRLAHDLGELLGEDHDLAVLDALISSAPERFGPAELIATLIAGRRHRLQMQARDLGARLYADKPSRFVAVAQADWKDHRPA